MVFNKLELPWVTVLVPNKDFYPVIGRYLNDRPFPNELQGCFGPISDGPHVDKLILVAIVTSKA